MKVLVAHTYYQQPGGEERSFEAEVALLRAHGHEVVTYTRHNDELAELSRARAAAKTVWNRRVHADLQELVARERPAVAHFNNTFPLMSPSVYSAASSRGAAVVQTLRNYRLTCVNGLFFRDGRACEDCLGRRLAAPGVLHACYRDSRAASAVVASMLALHRAGGTWSRKVDRYITLSEFARSKMARVLPPEKLAVKPNVVHPDPGEGTGGGGYSIFVGRLAPEKGVDDLLQAWLRLPGTPALKVVGDGPLRPSVDAAAESDRRIEALGHRPPEEVARLVGRARLLILPSRFYEGFPRAVVEALAVGTPVIAPNHGTSPEIVAPEQTGWLFEPGSIDDLATVISRALADPEIDGAMRRAARQTYLDAYAPERNVAQLIGIYEDAVRERRRRS